MPIVPNRPRAVHIARHPHDIPFRRAVVVQCHNAWKKVPRNDRKETNKGTKKKDGKFVRIEPLKEKAANTITLKHNYRSTLVCVHFVSFRYIRTYMSKKCASNKADGIICGCFRSRAYKAVVPPFWVPAIIKSGARCAGCAFCCCSHRMLLSLWLSLGWYVGMLWGWLTGLECCSQMLTS